MPTWLSNYWEFACGLAGLIVLLLFITIVGLAGWPGEVNTCAEHVDSGGCYCENINQAHPTQSAILQHPGVFAQPVNTWSNIGFMLLGLSMLWWLGWERTNGKQPAHQNLMTTTWLGAFYGFTTIFLGPGSMMFHASMRKWAGWFDPLSMNLFLGIVPAYNLVRLFKWPIWSGAVIYLALNTIEGFLNAVVPDLSLVWFICMGVLAILSQVFVTWPVLIRWLSADAAEINTAISGRVWFGTGVGFFALAMVIWRLSWTQAPLCNPDTFFQGHGAWHILSAAAVGCLYMYFRAEDAL
jgi:hypothetical protein